MVAAKECPTMTKNELAAWLQISLGHLHRMTQAGRVPEPVRFGRCVRFPVALIDAWIREGCPIRQAIT